MTTIDHTNSGPNGGMVEPEKLATPAEIQRGKFLGVFYLALAVLTFTVFGLDSQGDATLRLTESGDRFNDGFPDLSFNAQTIAYLVAIVLAIAGGVQLIRGFERWTTVVGIVLVVLFVVSFLGWAAAGTSFSLVGMLQASMVRAVPIGLGALAGVMCETSGVVNIAIEGMLLTGAFTAAVVGSTLGTVPGVIAAVLTGGLLAWVLAVLSIKYLVDQVIVGVVINIFALGLTSFLTARVLASNPEYNSAAILKPIEIPLVHDIPFIGPILFEQNVFVYAMLVLTAGVGWLLFRTRWGLRARAVGEHPRAADTLGVNVHRTQYLNVIIGGMIAGLGGSYFIFGSTGRFDENMTNGRGYIALAAMIFGKYRPKTILMAALIFGFADALQQKLGLLSTGIPSEFLLMAPFLITIIVVAGFTGGTAAPAHDGVAYVKEGQ